ncbi:unnamed protein product [Penicillium roqueforti FM164]|uniref:Genomic scaffold, ProqFM164S02 n=1 Tax=Penicillium roqueforti (strain FM164) TaxID=1365484 RepID=W6Q4U6_PENRF|nr:unnamed protein product [Penicillium roqueforti FM164]
MNAEDRVLPDSTSDPIIDSMELGRRVRGEQPILSIPIPFQTVYIDFVTGLPVSHQSFNPVAFITYKFTKRLRAMTGKTTWSSKDWALDARIPTDRRTPFLYLPRQSVMRTVSFHDPGTVPHRV